jgi:hypothetical protein
MRGFIKQHKIIIKGDVGLFIFSTYISFILLRTIFKETVLANKGYRAFYVIIIPEIN